MIVRLGSRERSLFAGLLLLALAQSLIVMIPAWAVQHIFDRLGRAARTASLPAETLVGIFIAGAVAAFLMEVLKRRLAAEMGLRHAAAIRLALFNRQISSNPQRPRNSGAALLPFVGDLTAVRRWVSEGLARGASALVLIPVMLVMIATRNLTLAIALGGVLTLSFACSALLVSPLDRAVRDVRKRRGELASFIAGRIEAASTIRASGRAGTEARKVVTRTNKLSDAERRRSWVVGATRGLALLTHSLLILAALIVGLFEAREGGVTAGTIAAALSLVGLLGAGVADLIRALELRQPAKVAIERIERRLARPHLQRLATPQPEIAEPGLVLLKLGIDGLLGDVSVKADPGARIQVDGAPGAGKSALIAAIGQSRPNYFGRVLLDGNNLKTMRPKRRGEAIGLASAELALLPGTLGMNLRYRSPGIGDAELLDLARHCGLGPLINRIGGLQGRLVGAGLSTGERHGLALARAIAGRPPLLLLDGIDGHLQAEAFEWLREQISTYPGIVLFVAAKPEMTALASARWLISEGRLKPSQTPSSNIVEFERPRA